MIWTWDASISTDVAHYVLKVALTSALSWIDVGMTPDLTIAYDPPTPAVGEVVFLSVDAVDFAGNRSE